MQPQDPREDKEHRGTAPALFTVHRVARPSVERLTGGPTTTTSLTAASTAELYAVFLKF